MGKLILNKKGIIGVLVFVLGVVLAGLFLSGRLIKIDNRKNDSITEQEDKKKNCDYSKRPVAVMFASDPIARPLSGISEADIVFEMPVTENGVTRMMAVYYCSEPEELGSVRSARKEFIPLAAALDALYVHWGGEHNALESLSRGVLDNIDALKYEDIYFYRKKRIKMPHNGFTSFEHIKKAQAELKYKNKSGLKIQKSLAKKVKEAGRDILTVDQSQPSQIPTLYSQPFDISWQYDPKEEKYSRFRNQKPEIDKNNSEQVKFDRIIVLKTTWSPVSILYIDVNVYGKGNALIYEQGKVFKGTWEKSSESAKSPLIIKYQDGQRLDILPGKTWIQYIF